MTKEFNWTVLFNKSNKIYTQLSFFVVVFFLFIILKEYPLSFTGASLTCIILQQTLEFAIPCYTQNYLVLPFFRQGKWIIGLILYIIQIVSLVYGLPYILNVVGLAFAAAFHLQNRIDWTGEHITFSMIAFTLIASIFKTALDKLIVDRDQKEMELKHLKAQLNPHFLFNTLNNLYGLSVAQSKRLPELMLKLSDLLRYSLYQTNQNYVSLEKELGYISNYLELEKIRLDNKTQIDYQTTGDFSGLYIAPLMLISFIENSFKHYSIARNQQAYVNILFVFGDNALHLIICNSLDPTLYTERKNPQGKGIGLTNVKQRLDLLYPRKYTLLITHEPHCYQVDLKIDLHRS
jgi:two-component system, LytTR family, sensor histidine kinase LytS